MVGPIRWSATCLAALALAAGGWTARAQTPTPPDADAKTPKAEAPAAPAPDRIELFERLGDDPPAPFVPRDPRTVEQGKLEEAVRLYAAARALEDRRRFAEAAETLEEAYKLDPDSVAIARRLSRLYVGPLARPEQAVEFGEKALAADPSDTETLERLFEFHVGQRRDFRAGEALLREVLANPKLAEHAAGRIVAWFELGRLYAGELHDQAQAADAFAKVMAELDDKESNKLTPADVQRILGPEPAARYLEFGLVFLSAGRDDLALKALERGLAYDENNPQIPLVLSEAYLKANQGDRALALVERYLKRQPQGIEAYELMARVLKALGREDEITPRLEAAARRDAKNVPLQYVLADRYREIGQVEKAEALYKGLLASQPTPQTYRALAASLVKRKKIPDLLKVLCEAVARPQGELAVRPQIAAAAEDDEIADALLDEGLKQLSADPPGLPEAPAFKVLGEIAIGSGVARDARPARLERLLKLQQLMLGKAPNPLLYIEVAQTQQNLGRHGDAAETLAAMFDKFPSERKPRWLSFQASFLHKAGQDDKALEAVRDALKQNPTDPDDRRQAAEVLADLGKIDEAVDVYKKLIRDEPGNPMYEMLMGAMLSRHGRDEDAIKHFQDMLKRNSGAGRDELVKMIYGQLSIAYVNQGDFANGEAELETALERFPDDAGINNDLGYLYADQGKNLEKAEAMIRKALKEDPDNYAYLDSMGWVLFKRGKFKEAVEPLEKAVELHRQAEKIGQSQPDATLPDHLGDVYLQLQEIEKARALWTEAEAAAARANPPDKRLEEIRKKLAGLDATDKAPRASTGATP